MKLFVSLYVFLVALLVVISAQKSEAGARIFLQDTPIITVFKEDDTYVIAGTAERVTADENSAALPVRFTDLTSLGGETVYIEKTHTVGLQVLLAAAGGSKRVVVATEKTSTGYRIKTVELRN